MMPIILLFIFQMYFLFIFRGIEYTSIRYLNLIKNVNSFDEINKNSEKILKNITQVRGLDFILRMIVTKHSFLLIHKEIVKIIWDKIVPSLHDLRTDLRIQIDSTKNILKWAVSEISENIHWTTELNAVSELQSARLDRQIEQFEELQRVLVKV